ncbi:MAG: DUF4240 domain-containing protein [Actinobacteria bacterium]|nr:DUF4240 domain-containing protein [Actinomycetota bacterium]
MSRTLTVPAILLCAALVLSGCALTGPLGGSTRAATTPPEESAQPVGVGTCPWPDPYVPTAATSSDPVAAAEALALPEDRFWDLLSTVPGVADKADFDAVSSALAGCARSDLIAFEARLTLALYALDGERNFDWIVDNDPAGLHFATEDSFLYSRCATIMAGRETWRHAVENGTLEWGADVTGSSEWLLFVGLAAAEAQGIDVDDYYDEVFGSIPISYETGSNTELWAG